MSTAFVRQFSVRE